MSGVRDGASVSLSRQLDMLAFILRNNKKGLKTSEIQFYMRVRHGVSKEWVNKYLTQWGSWGVITQKGIRFMIDGEKWKALQDTRSEEVILFEP